MQDVRSGFEGSMLLIDPSALDVVEEVIWNVVGIQQKRLEPFHDVS